MRSLYLLFAGFRRHRMWRNLAGVGSMMGLLLFPGCAETEPDQGAWIDEDALVRKTLPITDMERARLIRLEAADLVTIRPVALPRDEFLAGENRHLGWPVGIKVGDTLLCAYHRTRHHHGTGPQHDADSSAAVVVRSTDGGETWSDPVDLRQFGQSEAETVINFGICLGEQDGQVFLANKYGVYRSADEGVSWELLAGALTQDQTGHAYRDNVGPRMIAHPEKGLVIPVGIGRAAGLDLYSSIDDGEEWTHERVALPDEFHPLEPTAINHDGRLIFVSRNHSLPFKWFGDMTTSEPPVMMVSDTGWFPMTHQGITNIASFRWPDTTDVAFNPVTERFEAVVTNRNGGVGEAERDENNSQTVNLWSISPKDLYEGRAQNWRFECTLLNLRSGMGTFLPTDVDAAHPGGAIIDEARGLQHIFIYAGTYATPTGIYRISRTLDTERLRREPGR